MNLHYSKGLIYFQLHNLGYFGGGRCGNISIDGHYEIITDLKEFVIQQFGTYANFISINEKIYQPNLTEGEYKFVHDAILGALGQNYGNVHSIDLEMWRDIYCDYREKIPLLWKNLKHYKITEQTISPNIKPGDIVSKNGEKDKVTWYWDIKYINKCNDYKIVEKYKYSGLFERVKEKLNKSIKEYETGQGFS